MIRHFSFLFKYWPLLVLIVLTGFMIPLFDSVIVSFVFPILQGIQKGIIQNVPFPFNHIAVFFQPMNLPERLRIIALLMVGAIFMKGVMSYLNGTSAFKLQAIGFQHFRMLFIQQLMRIGMAYFNAQKFSDLQTLSSVYIINMTTLISMFCTCLTQALNVGVLITVLFLLSWKLMLFSCVLVIFASFVLRTLAKRTKAIARTYTKANKDINNVLLDAILGLKTIRLFNRENNTIDKVQDECNRFNSVYYRIGRMRSIVQPVYEAIGIGCMAAIIVIISLMSSKTGGVGIGVLAVFVVMFQRISNAMMTFNTSRVDFITNAPFAREFFKFLNREDKQLIKNGNIKFSGFHSKIEWEKVNFRYRETGELVLNNVSLNIPKGRKIGIVGSSGAGKSTFLELLFRFYDPQEGRILIDGVDLKDMDIGSWRQHIGMVAQDVFLFNDTVRANIAYAKPQTTQEEIELAARKAHAHEFIQAMPGGYDTILGERGVLLSGGQRQRIAIARAIMIQPEILVFDEATSALDTESERIVQNALDEVGKGRTVITIAHRLSTVFDSDVIFVFDQGKLVEQGSHQDLMEAKGIYYKLVCMQNLERDIHKRTMEELV